jgi:uncharacterized protein YodC (DUF2158 family)
MIEFACAPGWLRAGFLLKRPRGRRLSRFFAAMMRLRRVEDVAASSPCVSSVGRGFSQMTVPKPGDLVVLKSGGPVMTVDTVNSDIFDDDKITGVLCAWFVGEKLQRARFDIGAILPAPLSDTSSNATELAPQEIVGEYKVILDEMAAAMNDGAEATDASKAPGEKPKRASVRKYAAEGAVPADRRAS